MNAFNDFLKWESASRDTIDFKRAYADVSGDVLAGLVLSEIIYWHLPTKHGKSKLRVMRDDQLWIACPRAEWWERVRLTPRQVDSALGKLVEAGVVVKSVYKYGRTPTTHVRIDEKVFLDRLTIVTTVDRNRYYKSVKSPIRDIQEITDPLKPRKSRKRANPIPETTTPTTSTETTEIAAIAAVVKMPAKEFQTAFIAGLGYTDAAYKDGKFLTQVKNLSQLMHDCGLTPDDVPEFINFCRTQFKGKRLTPALIRDMVLPFEASRTVTLHIVEDVTPVHTPSTIAPDTKVIGDMTAAEFDALTPEERQTQIDLKLANIAGRIVGTEGGKRGRQADRNQLDELNKSA